LKKYENDNLKVYFVDDLVKNDSNLEKLKLDNYQYFCWSLASYFSDYLLNKDIESITYIDSDILLYTDIEDLLKEMGDVEVGIFKHRQFDPSMYRPEGLFNVGIVYFKKGDVGQHILKWWSDAVQFKKYPNLATCGDQKYLDEFPNMCPSELIFIDGNIGHGAPWQWQLYDFFDFKNDGSITWNGIKQKLYFTHFSQFKLNDDYSGYTPSTQHHIYTPLEKYKENDGLKFIYDDYFEKMIKTKDKYNG
jgi:hypothetical protein